MTNWYNAFILLVPLSIVVSALFGEKTAATEKEKVQKKKQMGAGRYTLCDADATALKSTSVYFS